MTLQKITWICPICDTKLKFNPVTPEWDRMTVIVNHLAMHINQIASGLGKVKHKMY